MALQIRRMDARLHVETTPSQMSIRSRQARLELTHTEARVDIRSEMPRVVIDQSECFATSGLMKPVDLTRAAAQRAMQQVLEYTGKIAADGDAMAAIENDTNVIVAIAQRDSVTEHEFGLDYIPKARPKITVAGGGFEINIKDEAIGPTNGVKGTVIPGSISFDYTPSKVNITLAQRPSIRIKYVPSKFDAYV